MIDSRYLFGVKTFDVGRVLLRLPVEIERADQQRFKQSAARIARRRSRHGRPIPSQIADITGNSTDVRLAILHQLSTPATQITNVINGNQLKTT